MKERRRRVLVIDDEVKLGDLVCRVLAREHDAFFVTSAQEALDLIACGERFDLILCDLMLPHLTGMDFHERLSAMAPELADRTVFMTGGAFTPRASVFLQGPSIAQIEKPFGLLELLPFVRGHLDRVRKA